MAIVPKYFIHLICSILCVLNLYVVGEEHKIIRDKNILFELDENIALSENKFTIILDIDVSTIRNAHQNLVTAFETLSRAFETQRQSGRTGINLQSAYGYITKMFETYDKESKSFTYIVAPNANRNRRGLFDSVGIAFKVLFGTATEYDIAVTRNGIYSLSNKLKDVSQVVADNILYMKGLEEKVISNTDQLRKLTETTLDTARKLNNFQRSIYEALSVIKGDMLVSGMMYQLGFMLNAFRIDIANLRAALELTALRKLSNVLLPNELFLQMLRNISRNIPSGLRMIAPITYEYLGQYYISAVTSAFTDGKKIYLVVKIPLISNRDNFEGYNIFTIPTYNEKLNKFVEYDLPSKLYVSKDKSKYFTTPNSNDLECVEGPNKICAYSKNIYKWNVPSCVINLFLKRDTSMCESQMLRADHPILKKTKSDLIFSVTKPTTLLISCYNKSGFDPETSSIKLTDRGVIQNVSNCEMNTDTVFLPSVYSTTLQHSLQIGYNISEIFSPQIQSSNFTLQNFSIEETKLKGILQDLDSQKYEKIPVNALIQRLKDINAREEFPMQAVATSFGFSTILILVVVAIAAFIFFKSRVAMRRNRAGKQTVQLNMPQTSNQSALIPPKNSRQQKGQKQQGAPWKP